MTTMQIGTCRTTQVLRLANTPQALARELASALTGAPRGVGYYGRGQHM